MRENNIRADALVSCCDILQCLYCCCCLPLIFAGFLKRPMLIR